MNSDLQNLKAVIEESPGFHSVPNGVITDLAQHLYDHAVRVTPDYAGREYLMALLESVWRECPALDPLAQIGWIADRLYAQGVRVLSRSQEAE